MMTAIEEPVRFTTVKQEFGETFNLFFEQVQEEEGIPSEDHYRTNHYVKELILTLYEYDSNIKEYKKSKDIPWPSNAELMKIEYSNDGEYIVALSAIKTEDSETFDERLDYYAITLLDTNEFNIVAERRLCAFDEEAEYAFDAISYQI